MAVPRQVFIFASMSQDAATLSLFNACNFVGRVGRRVN